MTDRPRLSKSRYISGTQCHLRLWYDTHQRNLATAPGEALQAVFETGHEVGEVACRRFPGGHLVAHDHRHVPQALQETRQVIETGAAPAVFEAAFEHERVLVRADVIERLPGGGWRLVEVKSTTRLKEVFLLDLAVQLWVLRGAGLDVRDAAVLTLDRSYVYDGVRLDLDALFKVHPRFDEAAAHLDTVGAQVRTMLRDLAAALPDRAPALRAIQRRLFDLHPVVLNGCYHPDFRGSFSIKNVLPALVLGVGYEDLEVADGQTAAVRYARALQSADLDERRGTFDELRAYCARDTQALVELRKALVTLGPDESPAGG